jgi:hypothetical protein
MPTDNSGVKTVQSWFLVRRGGEQDDQIAVVTRRAWTDLSHAHLYMIIKLPLEVNAHGFRPEPLKNRQRF